jgi:Tol biopolymer transport system component
MRGVPKVDYMIDLSTGKMTPLPKAIIRSVALSGDGGRLRFASRYAASPDGSLLAFVGPVDEESFQIFVAGMDGTGIHQVTHDPAGAASPAWSPDGTRIAYQRDGSGGDRHIFILDVDTGESTQVTNGTPVRPWAQPQFTPDGSSILYTSGTDQQPMLRAVSVAGGEGMLPIVLDEGLTDAGNGSLSPDGSLITFLASGFPTSVQVEHCGPCRFVANADGTEGRVITNCVSNPAGTWSPDGSRIVCVRMGPEESNGIIVVDIATGGASLVAEGHSAIWLDGHTLLVER